MVGILDQYTLNSEPLMYPETEYDVFSDEADTG